MLKLLMYGLLAGIGVGFYKLIKKPKTESKSNVQETKMQEQPVA